MSEVDDIDPLRRNFDVRDDLGSGGFGEGDQAVGPPRCGEHQHSPEERPGSANCLRLAKPGHVRQQHDIGGPGFEWGGKCDVVEDVHSVARREVAQEGRLGDRASARPAEKRM